MTFESELRELVTRWREAGGVALEDLVQALDEVVLAYHSCASPCASFTTGNGDASLVIKCLQSGQRGWHVDD